MKHRNASLSQELEKLRREREKGALGRGSPSAAMTAELQREGARREAFERKAAELEGVNNQLRQSVRVSEGESLRGWGGGEGEFHGGQVRGNL